MNLSAPVLLAAAFGTWIVYQVPLGPGATNRSGYTEQIARDIALAHQDAVAQVQATGAAGAPLAVPSSHPDQDNWSAESCSDGTWVATYAGLARTVDEGALFRALDDLLDGPLTVGTARAGQFRRHGTTIAPLPCSIADGKAVLMTHS